MDSGRSVDMIPTSLEMIPQWCKRILLELDSQPVKHWIGSLHDQSKVLLVSNTSNVLTLHSLDECNACEMIVNNARNLTSVEILWNIHSIDRENAKLYQEDHTMLKCDCCGDTHLRQDDHNMLKCVGDGLELLYYDCTTIPSKDVILKSIDEVISILKQGWERVGLVDFPYCHSTYELGGSVWVYYTKNPLLHKEDSL